MPKVLILEIVSSYASPASGSCDTYKFHDTIVEDVIGSSWNGNRNSPNSPESTS